MIASVIEILFSTYTFLLILRVISSWIPELAQTALMGWVRPFTDPYLDLFRRIIPPLGMIDISPLFAFIGLQILEGVILKLV